MTKIVKLILSLFLFIFTYQGVITGSFQILSTVMGYVSIHTNTDEKEKQ